MDGGGQGEQHSRGMSIIGRAGPSSHWKSPSCPGVLGADAHPSSRRGTGSGPRQTPVSCADHAAHIPLAGVVGASCGYADTFGFSQSSISYELLTAARRRPVSAIRPIADPGADGGPALTHEAEDIAIVLQGQVSVEVAGVGHELEENDSIHFNSEFSQRRCNRSKHIARATWISFPPYS